MKNQALFSLKDKSKKLKCRLLQFLFGALRVNVQGQILGTQEFRNLASLLKRGFWDLKFSNLIGFLG